MTVKLKVENPCPFLLMRMDKNGDNYFCKSCSKTIIDFTQKTQEEIKCAITPDTCGIFTVDQLHGQQKRTFLRHSIFYLLTLLSFLGFGVKPLSAQTIDTTRTKNETIKIDPELNNTDTIQTDKSNNKKIKGKNDRKGLFRKKKKYRVIGTPSF
ncbi:MAG: hypothetical protein SH856_07315 [Flavobacteriales bacterium]|nr:hypothetical protein [Flavobacteriales bacterium]